MTSGKVVLVLGVLALCALIVGAWIWVVSRVIWPWDIHWVVFGFNSFLLVKIGLAGLCFWGGFGILRLIFIEIMDSDVNSFYRTLSFLPAERVEKNRLDTERRAEQARRDGSYGEALRLYLSANNFDKAQLTLRYLPNDVVPESLFGAIHELKELERGLGIARSTRVPEAVTSRLGREAGETKRIIWERAERIAAVAEYDVESPRIEEALQRESERLDNLEIVIRQARESLAELTLAGGAGSRELGHVESRFRMLVETAQALQDEDLA